MPIFIEDLPIGSKLVRIYDEGKSYANRDKYAVALVLVFEDDAVEVKGLDKPLTLKQIKELKRSVNEFGLPIVADRNKRQKIYNKVKTNESKTTRKTESSNPS